MGAWWLLKGLCTGQRNGRKGEFSNQPLHLAALRHQRSQQRTRSLRRSVSLSCLYRVFKEFKSKKEVTMRLGSRLMSSLQRWSSRDAQKNEYFTPPKAMVGSEQWVHSG